MPLGFLATWAHTELALKEHPQVPFCRAALSQPVVLYGFAETQVQDMELGLLLYLQRTAAVVISILLKIIITLHGFYFIGILLHRETIIIPAFKMRN